MISVISQYRLIEAVQAGSSSAKNSNNPMLGRLGGNGGRRTPADGPATAKDQPGPSFDKLLEMAVNRYR